MSTESKAGNTALDILKWLVAALFLAGAVSVNYLYADLGTLYRVLAMVALMLLSVGAAFTTTHGQSFLVLLKEANKERRKVVWPTPIETRQTTLVVVAVVFIAGLGLWLLDMGLSWLVKLIIG
ncbi:MAG: preprotein translocase subunit SecE [Oleibacter sp.]|nr:preprotein translocase subunit SecE [Thalassolituus sp.]